MELTQAEAVIDIINAQTTKQRVLAINQLSGKLGNKTIDWANKIKNILGYAPKRSIEMAIKDLCNAFKKNLIPNSFENEIYFNVKRLKGIKAL